MDFHHFILDLQNYLMKLNLVEQILI